MTNIEAGPDQQNEVDSRWTEIDKIVAGGWDAVNGQIRMTSVRLVELAANIHAHRKLAMSMEERRDSGLLDLNLDIHIDDFVNLIAGFRPLKRLEFKLSHPPFDSPFDSVRNEFPSSRLLSAHIKAIDLALFTTVDAAEVLSERPGMPVPTFEQLAVAYVEIARLKGILNVLETVISSNLSSGAKTDADLFGVGLSLAPTIRRMIPPRCVPEQAKITLPESVSIDVAVAAHLLLSLIHI